MKASQEQAPGSEELEVHVLSVALVGPHAQRRAAIANVIAGGRQAKVTHEFASYPEIDDVAQLVDAGYEVLIVDLDSDPEAALDVVENVCSNSAITVMVYSAQSDPELLVRCMRAGAREFLTLPIAASTMAEALVRTSVRRPTRQAAKKALGKVFVFVGAKGGSGVSTLASSFAVSLIKESGQSTLLLDLDLPLGGAALDLGINPQFSTANAIQNVSRLDSTFLATLLAKHSSGLAVLAAPDKYTPVHVSDDAITKLLTVARQDFEYVVVDGGSVAGRSYEVLFEVANTVYLVTQVSISELRNSNRIISEFFPPPSPSLEVVLNRFTPNALGIDEAHITKALTVAPTWRVPSDYETVLRAQNTATSLALGESAIAQVIKKMARTASGLPAVTEKKRRFGLFG